MKNTGDTISAGGKIFTLGKKIGGGTEGMVFDVLDYPNYVIKLLNTAKMSDNEKLDTLNRLKWLKDNIGNSELKQKLAIPRALIDEDLGYIMVNANEHKKLDIYFAYPRDEQEFKQWLKDDFRLKKRFQIISFMFSSLEKIHIHGLIFTDLSPNNIMVHTDKNNLVFIDTDNMRKRDDPYTGVLGTDGYMAPEIYHLMDKKLNDKLKEKNIKIDREISFVNKLTVDSDIFSAAVIAFQLLTLQHPFVGDNAENGTAEEETEARHCRTDYILHRNRTNICTTNPFIHLFENRETVSDDLFRLFYKTFVDGKLQPKLRPTALEFFDACNKALDMIIKCPDCGVDVLYNTGKFDKCWYCDSQLPEQIHLKIFSAYEVPDRASLISKITDSNYSSNSITGENNFELSDIVLTVQETKYLNMKHFERTTGNSSALFAITLIDDMSKIIKIQVNMQENNAITANSLLVHKQNKTVVPIDKAKEFPCDEYDICFELLNTRVGKIRTYGRIFKGRKEW